MARSLTTDSPWPTSAPSWRGYVRALGLLAGGVAVGQLVDPFDIESATTALALLAVGCSVVLVIGGYLRWVAVQRAIRRGESLPAPLLVPVVAVALGLVAVVSFVLIAVG